MKYVRRTPPTSALMLITNTQGEYKSLPPEVLRKGDKSSGNCALGQIFGIHVTFQEGKS